MTDEIITADRQLLVFLLSSIMAMLEEERNMNPVLRQRTDETGPISVYLGDL